MGGEWLLGWLCRVTGEEDSGDPVSLVGLWRISRTEGAVYPVDIFDVSQRL